VTAGSSTEATIDLGENPSEHNEVQIETTGRDFRRRVTVEGSDSVGAWKTLRSDAVIFAFQSDGKSVESNSVTYPASRYRYLRVRVSADELSDRQAPDITNVKALMTVHEKGESTTWGLNVPSYQLLRNQGAHASSWIIDLGHAFPANASVSSLPSLLFIARSWWSFRRSTKSAVNRKRQLESQNRRREQPASDRIRS
jgi:hypothetical protein